MLDRIRPPLVCACVGEGPTLANCGPGTDEMVAVFGCLGVAGCWYTGSD